MQQILLVDDEKSYVLSLAKGLSTRLKKVKLLTAHNGKEALEVLKSNSVDLLVTDLKMPEMDGFELLAEMNNLNITVPTIVMTAFGTPKVGEQLRELGAVEYLEKPTELAVITDKIKQALAADTKGYVQGISLATFAQLMEMEKKTCTMLVKTDGKAGRIYFHNGELLDAQLGDLSGEAAAYVIFAWDDVDIKVEPARAQKEQRINVPLNHLLIEALRLKDEKNWKNKNNDGKGANEDLQTELDSAFSDTEKEPTTRKKSASNPQPKEENIMSAEEKLSEFKAIEGFAGVAVFTPAGEPLAMLSGDAKINLKEIGILANNVLMNAQKASLDMGTGRGQLVHVEAEKAHIFVRCMNEGTDPLKSQPGKAHIHLVLILTSDAGIGLAKLKIDKLVTGLADDFRV
jgi:CheY-like chemotaxis protein/predicted DNA-binding protein (UPF0251 family)